MKVVRPLFLLAAMLLISLFATPGGYTVAEEEGSSIPVHFLENREISLDLYPAGFQSAAVFTGEDIDGTTAVAPLKRIAAVLGNNGIGGTFFVYPDTEFRRNIGSAHLRVRLLRKLIFYGFEIAQAGPPAPLRRDIKNNQEEKIIPADNFNRSEQIGEIKTDRKILSGLGDQPEGYRDYGDPAVGILSVLARMGYLYRCRRAAPPASRPRSENSQKRGGRDDCFYPECREDMQILDFYSRIDPTESPLAARELFEKISRESGALIYYISLTDAVDEGVLERLRGFIKYLKGRNAWLCSLRELSRWWLARRTVEIESRVEDDTLIIIYDNPTRFLLKNARLNFRDLKVSARYYRVEDREGVVASQGIIPDFRSVNVTLFPARPGS